MQTNRRTARCTNTLAERQAGRQAGRQARRQAGRQRLQGVPGNDPMCHAFLGSRDKVEEAAIVGPPRQ